MHSFFLGPSVGPANVSFVSYNKTTFNISWAPLTREKSYGRVILYDVKQELLSRRKRRKRSPSNSRTFNTTATFVVLYDLSLCSRYNVSVRAYTSAGPGPYTQPRVLETSEYNHDVLVHMLVHVMHVEFREGLQHAGFAKEVLSDSLRLVDFQSG